MFMNSIIRRFTLNSILLFPKSRFLQFGRSRPNRAFLDLSDPLISLRLKPKEVLPKSEVILIRLNLRLTSVHLLRVNQLIHIIDPKLELQMLRQILPLAVLKTRNFNRMDVQLARVNDRVSLSEYFSDEAESSDGDPVNVSESVLRVAVLVEPFDVDAQIDPNAWFKDLAGHVGVVVWFDDLFRAPAEEDSSAVIFFSLDNELDVDELSNRNKYLKNYERKNNTKSFLLLFRNRYWTGTIHINGGDIPLTSLIIHFLPHVLHLPEILACVKPAYFSQKVLNSFLIDKSF